MKLRPELLLENKRLTDYPHLRDAVVNYQHVLKVKTIRFKFKQGFDQSLMMYMN